VVADDDGLINETPSIELEDRLDSRTPRLPCAAATASEKSGSTDDTSTR